MPVNEIDSLSAAVRRELLRQHPAVNPVVLAREITTGRTRIDNRALASVPQDPAAGLSAALDRQLAILGLRASRG